MSIVDNATHGLRGEKRKIVHDVRALWNDGYSTADMARFLNVTEHECERVLHYVLAIRRSVIGTMKVVK